MTKRSIRDLERQVKKEPDNLVVRLLLAAAYREAGRTSDAVPLYRSVADSYQRQGRKTQAVAVLRSLLEVEPADAQTHALLDELGRDDSGPAPAPPAPPGAPTASPLVPPSPLPGPPRPGDSGDFARPSTIPSLDGQRLRQTGQAPSARVLSDDVVLRDLSPVRPPGVPATRPGPTGPSPGSTLTGLGAAGPGARKPTPSRGSTPFYTPTPLPRPVPFHEVEATTDHERVPPPAEDEDAMTRVADSFHSGRAAFPPPLRPATEPPAPPPAAPAVPPPLRPTTEPPPRASTAELTTPDADLAGDLETRRVRRLTERELGIVSLPPPGQTDLVSRIEPHDLDADTNPDAGPRRAGTLDDEPTRYLGDAPVDTPAAPPSRPSNEFEGPTGVRPATPAPTPPAPAPRRPPPPAARAPHRPPPRRAPTPPPDADEPTRVAPDSERLAPASRQSTHGGVLGAGADARDTAPVVPRGDLDEATDVRDGPPMRASEPGRHRSRVFELPFAEAVQELDPDGAAIDAPLDVFSMLPPAALEQLGRGMTLRRYAPGEVVVREGDPGEACYVIADGEVRVLKNDPLSPDAGPVEVARLGPRALFGEFALLADRRRHATVQATTACDLYEIPRYLLREIAAAHPGVGPALQTFYRQRVLANLLRTAPFFAPLPEEQRTRLLARFVPIRADAGEPVIREGAPAGGLYLIVLGSVEITRRLERNRSVILATLREGAYFGEMSLLSGEPASATVVAVGTVELALLPPRDFYEIVAEHPQLWAAIRREARTRAMENARILAGDSGAV